MAPQALEDPLVAIDISKAAQALLRTPLMHADSHPDELALIRRHRAALTKLFAENLGYRLTVEPTLARLFKTGLGADASRGLRRRNGELFTPRRYALLALTLAALTRSRQQVMVDDLVGAVRSAAVDANVEVDLDNVQDRRALHSALMALVDLGVLSERDGDLEHWAERATHTLLDVHRDRLAVLIAAPLGACENPEDVLAVTAAPSAVGGARVAIRRRLAEQPVLSTEDLSEEQRGWWRRNRNGERDWFQRNLGLELELRAEGAIAIDPAGELTDRPFPGAGAVKHYALLLLDELVDELRTEHGSDLDGVAWAHVAHSTARLAGDRVFNNWRPAMRKAHRERPDELFDEAIEVLMDAGLVRQDTGGIEVHAAAARYAPKAEMLTAPAPTGERSLFEAF